MPTNTSLLQGEIIEDPEKQILEVEALLAGFFRSLLVEADPSRERVLQAMPAKAGHAAHGKDELQKHHLVASGSQEPA
jgi:hypothetical protein